MIKINSWKDLVKNDNHPLMRNPARTKFHNCNIILAELDSDVESIINGSNKKGYLNRSIRSKFNSLCKELECKDTIKNIRVQKDLKAMYPKYIVGYITINGIDFITVDHKYLSSEYTLLEFNNCNIFIPNRYSYDSNNFIYNCVFESCYIHLFALKINSDYYNNTRLILSKSVFSNCVITSDDKLNAVFIDKSILFRSRLEKLKNSIMLKISTDHNYLRAKEYKVIIYDCCIGKYSNYCLKLSDIFGYKIDIKYTDMYIAGLNNFIGSDNIDIFKDYNRTEYSIRLIGKRYMPCPEKGEFESYKIVLDSKIIDDLNRRSVKCGSIINNLIEKYAVRLTLKIPKDAKRTSGLFTDSCRCNKAEVIEATNTSNRQLYDIDPKKKYISLFEFYKAIQLYKTNPTNYEKLYMRYFPTKYIIGKTIEAKFEECRLIECGEGIHFFMTKELAANYLNLIIKGW